MNNQKFNFIKKNQNFQLDKTHEVIKLGIKKEIVKKKFTRSNKFIVKLRMRFGKIGICIGCI